MSSPTRPGDARQALPGRALAGRTVVITGASDGIGRAAARLMAIAGATIVMVGRNEAKTRAAAQAIMSETGQRTVEVEIADLLVQEQVHALAGRLRERHPRIDVLVNNAGALFLERRVTADGLERTFALNHLAYFTLSLLLIDCLSAAGVPGSPSRIINVASRAHRDARLRIDDLQMSSRFHGWRAYANSKLCNVLFTRALARRADPARLVVHAVHPGLVSTRFATNNGAMGRLIRRVMNVTAMTPEQGADSVVWLAAAPDAAATSGDYWVRRKRTTPSRAARDDSLGEALWNASATLARLDADAIVHEAEIAVR